MINYSLKKIRIIKDNKNDLFLIINVIINNLSNNSLCAPMGNINLYDEWIFLNNFI